eukprot:TRINITY_DN833_c0_g1_i2.p1 TRINITY_DN833_c0_g1~~TRINITY_DN833_c0_g1_i2.p1  ORF type:complete len:164 (+),score=30.10 TRINITY_DN833_c0_g1_i2:1272-1763(+)
MYALGAENIKHIDKNMYQKHMEIAKGIGRFCGDMYEKNPTNLPCENVRVSNSDIKMPNHAAASYTMRPEAIETWFYLWRYTKDPIWRDLGWKAFLAMIKHTRTDYGFSGLRDSRQEKPLKDQTQQSYFLAETLKYLYLLFCPDDVLPLDKFVFNTEAHPIRIK